MRIMLLVGLALCCASCSATTQSVQDRPSPQMNISALQDERHEAPDSQEQNVPQNGTERQVSESGQVDQLQESTKRFNSKLQSIMGQDRAKEADAARSSKNATLGQGKKVSFNFYDADLLEVVRLFMDLLEDDYMLHNNVGGRVSLSVDDKFTETQLIDLLRGILRINNVGMIKKGKVWEIMPLAEVPRHVSGDQIVVPEESSIPKRGQIIKGFRLRFVPAAEMIKIMKPYLSESAQVYAHERKGILLVSDYPHTLEKVGKLINLFDESVFAEIHAQVYPLRYLKSEDAVKDLEAIAKEFELTKEKGGPGGRVSFLALERLNMVLSITRNEKILEFVDAWVEQLDQELPTELQEQYGQNIFVYYVQYGEAKEIVSSLRGLFQTESRDEEERARGSEKGDGKESEDTGSAGSGPGPVAGELAGPVRFMVDEATNSILVKASNEDYQNILSVIEKLDQYPKQVLIEVVIAEVTLDDSSKLGIEWQYITELADDVQQDISLDSGLGSISQGATRIGSGLSYLVTKTDELTALVKALSNNNLVQILSTPTLLASDNKEATINIGDEVPIPTSTERRLDDTGTSEITETTIQYRDTGIILKVTPKINKQGMVHMDISQEVSNLSEVNVENVDAPVISTRNAKTSVSVNDQETIVIGGLMEQQKNNSSSGVPVLDQVPLLKYLFGFESRSIQKTELMIFITPHVVLNEQDSRDISREFLQRLKVIKKSMS